MNKSELRKYIIEVMSENKYAICTASIAKTAGTTERSKWSDAAIKRYEDCKKDVGNDVNEEMNLGMDQELEECGYSEPEEEEPRRYFEI
jgi:hypothetical protein